MCTDIDTLSFDELKRESYRAMNTDYILCNHSANKTLLEMLSCNEENLLFE